MTDLLIRLARCAHICRALAAAHFFVSMAINTTALAAETCIQAQVFELCANLEEVARTVDPAALRQAYLDKVPQAQRSAVMRGRTAIEHPRAQELRRRWNETARRVLGQPPERLAFYRSVLESGDMMRLANMQLDLPVVFRVTGLPHSPQASVGPGLVDMLRLTGDPELSKLDPQMVIGLMNLVLATPVGVELGATFNMMPLLAEFLYQLRIIHGELDKDVVVFSGSLNPDPPSVDLAGTLYVPDNFFEQYDAAEQELVLLHEAAHLLIPPGSLLMQLLMNRTDSLGPIGKVMGSPEFRQLSKRANPDIEPEVDAEVLLFLARRVESRNRYVAMLRRVAPERAGIVEYLNEQMNQGTWPRRAVRLSVNELPGMVQAMARYENSPDAAVKVVALVELMERMVVDLPEQDRAFYRPLMELLVKYQISSPARMIAGTGARYMPSMQDAVEEGVVILFEEVIQRWKRQ